MSGDLLTDLREAASLDKEAFGRLIRHEWPALARILGVRSTAQEQLLEVFEALFEALGGEVEGEVWNPNPPELQEQISHLSEALTNLEAAVTGIAGETHDRLNRLEEIIRVASQPKPMPGAPPAPPISNGWKVGDMREINGLVFTIVEIDANGSPMWVREQ